MEKMGKGEQEFLNTALSEKPSIRFSNDGYFEVVVWQGEYFVAAFVEIHEEGAILLALERRG